MRILGGILGAVVVLAGCSSGMPAECSHLPVCEEVPSYPVCPDPRCCERTPSGHWRVVTLAIWCGDVIEDVVDLDLSDAQRSLED
jgi:hypothetical protein